ncbi:hypothetical protein [Acidocella aminolytica]|uniref:Uncharacterized protein n=1 Tax=Acidocella aminolytica 101 = DSM 11237 TaxID=1120923 RepID=A0A0D6PCE2_9PROT|nr:hypothetical protein [Acidocella aminolytica]GAN79026.1 hypothetical protein Aam_015_036 [Acidocella aminolytica 101 = DSM 11237]
MNSKITPKKIRRAVAHLLSRAEWLRRRREPDPACRAALLAAAAECERLAADLSELAPGGAK